MTDVVETNPYDAPNATLAETSAVAAPRFYVVAPRKFWILYVATFGFYRIYWMYQHWTNLKRARKSDEWPVMRGLFGIFFVHSLFAEFDQELTRRQVRFDWNRGATATTIVVLMLAGVVVERVAARGIGGPYISLTSLLLLPALAFLTGKGQAAANAACLDPTGDSNRRFTAANIIWLILCALWWLLVLVGLFFLFFMPEEL